jgi:RnfABCDGE-type electron transport complex B subunit
MNDVILYTLITLGGIGALSSIILFFVAQKFKVIEDPRIDLVEEVLPLANCGGCGYPGCRNFADACVKAEDLNSLYCPVGGNETMSKVASVLGQTVEGKESQVAVLLCNGSNANRKHTSIFDSAANCTIAANTYGGETECTHGCLGLGECVDACNFNAMYMDPVTGLPVVIEDNCTACGACVKACPKNLFELRNKGKKSRRIYVACMNTDKGAPAKKACDTACIGCSLCFKACKYDAITMANNKAYIDYNKCVLCRACVEVCPTNAIHELNFPPRKVKPAKEEVANEPSTEVKSENQ